MADRTIEVLLTLNPDDASFTASEKALLRATERINRAMVAAHKQVERERVASFQRTREQMEKLAQVGTRLAALGAVIVAPFALAMGKYVTAAKAAQEAGKPLDKTQRALLALSQQWEASQLRLGKITAEIVLPALEKGASVLDKVIKFAEANPGIVKAALTIGTTLVVLGGLITMTAQLVATVATIQGLAAGGGALAGVGGAAAGAAQIVIPLAIGAVIGKALGDVVNSNPAFVKGADAQVAVVSAGVLKVIQWAQGKGIIGKDFRLPGGGGADAGPTASLADLTQQREQEEAAIKRTTAAIALSTERHVELAKLETESSVKRQEAVQEATDKIADIEASGAAKRIALIASAVEENRKAEAAYNQERAKIAADGGREIAQIEQDSQKRIEQLKSDFAANSENLTRSRDALGLVKAQQDFKSAVDQERQNTQDEIEQRRQDIATRLQDLATAYQYEQQQRQYALNAKLAEQAAADNAEITAARAKQAQVLADLALFYDNQIMALRAAIAAARIDPALGAGGIGSRAEGGYVDSGLYRLGERGREFVLNNQTTRAAESLLGGRLNQSRALGLVTNNLQMGAGVTIRQVQRLVQENMSGMISTLASTL